MGGRLKGGVVVFVVNVVTHPEELLTFIRNRNENGRCAEDLLGRDFAKIGGIRISLKGENAGLQVFHFELVDDLVEL